MHTSEDLALPENSICGHQIKNLCRQIFKYNTIIY